MPLEHTKTVSTGRFCDPLHTMISICVIFVLCALVEVQCRLPACSSNFPCRKALQTNPVEYTCNKPTYYIGSSGYCTPATGECVNKAWCSFNSDDPAAACSRHYPCQRVVNGVSSCNRPSKFDGSIGVCTEKDGKCVMDEGCRNEREETKICKCSRNYPCQDPDGRCSRLMNGKCDSPSTLCIADDKSGRKALNNGTSCEAWRPCLAQSKDGYVCNEPNYAYMNGEKKPFCSAKAGNCTNPDLCYGMSESCSCTGSNRCKDEEGKCVQYANWDDERCPKGSSHCSLDGKVLDVHCPYWKACLLQSEGKDYECNEPDYHHQNALNRPFCPAAKGKCSDEFACYDATSLCFCPDHLPCREEATGKCVAFTDKKTCPEKSHLCFEF